jgi:hypothetical protein
MRPESETRMIGFRAFLKGFYFPEHQSQNDVKWYFTN